MKTMTKLMMMAVLVISFLFPSGLVAQAETPVKSGDDLYELNVMAKKIEPICKKNGLVARNSYVGSEGATCVDKNDNMLLTDVTPIFVGTTTKNVSLAVDVMVHIGSKDTKTELLNAVAKAKKKTDYGVYAKGGTMVTVRSRMNEVHFINYNSFKDQPIIKADPFKLNTLAKKIEPVCKKFGFIAKNVRDSATCVDKKKKDWDLVVINMKDGYVISSPSKIRDSVTLTTDIAYLLGKKDSKAELVRVSKLAQKTPHKYVKTKNGTPVVSDKGGRVSIPFTKAKIEEINKSIKK